MKSFISACMAFVAGAASVWFIASSDSKSGMMDGMAAQDAAEEQPLYWVAPMDPGFRRDAPGKSPMGMDLVPVYASEQQQSAGEIMINPDVVNNIGVSTAKAFIDHLAFDIRTSGEVKYDPEYVLHMHSRASGWIEKLYVADIGQPVKKGDPLYALYSPELVDAKEDFIRALQAGIKSQIRAAENRLRSLRVHRKVIQGLRKAPRKEVDQLTVFYAERSGVMEMLNIQEGFYVKPEMTLMSIADPEHKWIVADVTLRQAESLKTGLKGTASRLYGSGQKPVSVEIDYIYPELNSQKRTARIRAQLGQKSGEVFAGEWMMMNFIAESADETVLIPQNALIRTGDQNRVVISTGEGSFKSVEVSVGLSNGHCIQILSGLEAGDRVVTSAQFLIDSESSESSDFRRYSHGEG